MPSMLCCRMRPPRWQRHLAELPDLSGRVARLLRTAVHAQALVAEERAPSPNCGRNFSLQFRLKLNARLGLRRCRSLFRFWSDARSAVSAHADLVPNWLLYCSRPVGSLLALNISLRGNDSSDRGRVVGRFAATADAPDPSLGGDIRYIEDENLLVLEMHDLPTLPTNGSINSGW